MPLGICPTPTLKKTDKNSSNNGITYGNCLQKVSHIESQSLYCNCVHMKPNTGLFSFTLFEYEGLQDLSIDCFRLF